MSTSPEESEYVFAEAQDKARDYMVKAEESRATAVGTTYAVLAIATLLDGFLTDMLTASLEDE
jgi:hypothetical protein